MALRWFVSRGFSLRHQNWRCRYGELDLVLERDGVLHVVEVKARRGKAYGGAVAAVGPQKEERLRAAVELYRAAHPDAPKDVRLFVFALQLAGDGTADGVLIPMSA